MIPDLGKYAADVLAAYGVALTLLIALILISLRQAATARKRLQQAQDAQPPKTETNG